MEGHAMHYRAAPARTAGESDLLPCADQLVEEMDRIRSFALVFERWHEEMTEMNTNMGMLDSKGEDLTAAARELIMVSLNAAIEGARAEASARGFTVVAAEIKNTSHRIRILAKEIGEGLHSSALTTTATFQDIQAGGKMMMTALSSMQTLILELRQRIRGG